MPQQAWTRYIQGQPEPIVSHFLSASTDPQTMILRSLVVLGGSVPRQELLTLLENSFAVWQRVDRGGEGWDEAALEGDLESLVQAQLVDIEPSGLITVTELGRYAGESGIEVRSVTQVSSLLRYLPAGTALTEADLVLLAQVTVELDGVTFPVARKSRQEQHRWPTALAGLGAHIPLLNGIHVGGGEPIARTKKAVAALRFASAFPMAAVEAELMQHMRDNAAAGPIRAVAARTRDVIDAVATICCFRGYEVADDEALLHIGVRLEIGLPAEVGRLASAIGGRLSRAQYFSLAENGVATYEALANTSEDRLRELLGDSLAREIRQQVDSTER